MSKRPSEAVPPDRGPVEKAPKKPRETDAERIARWEKEVAAEKAVLRAKALDRVMALGAKLADAENALAALGEEKK